MSDTLARYLSRQIRAERARLGLSQEALGSRLGMSKSAVSALETGVRSLHAAELPEVCEALGIDLLTLLARADETDKRRLGL
ncbi:MAG TPA: helix-turn-helix transcriptional regulator [Kineosporiaceae bacterium]|nr:helix-turn-helix transcriptional regulator [Kineosporiaceae bacterium]